MPHEHYSLFTHNRTLLEAEGRCYCSYCFHQYPFSDIYSWLEDEGTAVCPVCCVDAVFPLSKKTEALEYHAYGWGEPDPGPDPKPREVNVIRLDIE